MTQTLSLVGVPFRILCFDSIPGGIVKAEGLGDGFFEWA